MTKWKHIGTYIEQDDKGNDIEVRIMKQSHKFGYRIKEVRVPVELQTTLF